MNKHELLDHLERLLKSLPRQESRRCWLIMQR